MQLEGLLLRNSSSSSIRFLESRLLDIPSGKYCDKAVEKKRKESY